MSKKNLGKLKARILEDGFNVPFFVWDNKGTYICLDGHGRIQALLSLKKSGYKLPDLPVAFIEASDEADARKKLLAISSQYGDYDYDSLDEWLKGLDDSVSETLRLVDSEINLEDRTDEESINIVDDPESQKKADTDPKAYSVVVFCSGSTEREGTLSHLIQLGYTAQAMDLSIKKK